MTLLALTLLVGLVFYVYNVGTVVNRRLAVQNAADATAVSGAAWMARSMNVIALNNVAQARMLALVAVLDSLPQASRMAHEEVSAWIRCLDDQLARGGTLDWQWGARDLILEGLNSVRNRLVDERDILAVLDQQLNGGGFDMAAVTHWSLGGGGPDGALWRAAVAMSDFSDAAALSAGALAQANAVRFGKSNPVETAFLAPVLPEMPAVRGSFANFQPVLEGKEQVVSDGASVAATGGAGGAIPDGVWPHRLGPWARLFRWRDELREAVAWEYVPPESGPRVRGGRGSVNIGGRRTGSSAVQSGAQGGQWRVSQWQVIGYTTYGPYAWALRRITDHCVGDSDNPGELRDALFHRYVQQISRIKLDYMFGPHELKQIHRPEWIVDYAEARRQASADASKIRRTMFYLVEIASSVPPGPGWLAPGTYRTNGDEPLAIWTRRWTDPERWGVPTIGEHVWKDQYTYETEYDEEIGIFPEREDPNDPDSPLKYHTVYMVAYYVWGGIDIGPDEDVRNPCNWSDGATLPHPLLLDTSQGDYDPALPEADAGVRRQLFTFLGVASQADRAPAWPQQFSSASPVNSVVAVAQAELFNNTSWDLWTQDWQAQLVPVTQWDDWVRRLELGVAQAGLTDGQVSEQDVGDMHDYMMRMNREFVELYKAN